MILKKNTEQGFTIVELLIVIVVIAILAAITIVSYNGIKQRANASAAKSNAASVKSVAEAYNSDDSVSTTGYPSLANIQAYSGITKLPAGVSLVATAPTSTSDVSAITYLTKGTTGVCIGYWDQTGAGAVAWLYTGDASTVTGTTCS